MGRNAEAITCFLALIRIPRAFPVQNLVCRCAVVVISIWRNSVLSAGPRSSGSAFGCDSQKVGRRALNRVDVIANPIIKNARWAGPSQSGVAIRNGQQKSKCKPDGANPTATKFHVCHPPRGAHRSNQSAPEPESTLEAHDNCASYADAQEKKESKPNHVTPK